MATDLYPTLPPRKYRVSRMLRVLVVSFFLALLLEALIITFVRFVWETFFKGEYTSQIALLGPAFVVIWLFMAWVFWENAERLGGDARLRPM